MDHDCNCKYCILGPKIDRGVLTWLGKGHSLTCLCDDCFDPEFDVREPVDESN